MFPVMRECVFTGAIPSKCVRMTSKCCTRSFSCRDILVARCFLNIAVIFRGSFKSTLVFPTTRLDVA